MMLMVKINVMPAFESFAGWFSVHMPELQIENGIISSPVKQPYQMVHPDFGNIMIVDTGKEEATSAETGKTILYVTKHRIYARNPVRNETRIFDLASETQKERFKKAEKISGPMVLDFFRKARPIFTAIFFFSSAIFFFMWKLSAAIFYSLIALILNQFREEKFGYPALLNTSIFATTAVSVLQIMGLMTGNPHFQIPVWMAAAVTTLYLGLALLIASPPESSVDSSRS